LTVLRFSDHDIFKNLDGVLETILKTLKENPLVFPFCERVTQSVSPFFKGGARGIKDFPLSFAEA